MPQVDNVNAEQPEQHQRLGPLGGIAPERAAILDHERPHIIRDPRHRRHNSLEAARQSFGKTLLVLPDLKPAPPAKDASPALNGGSGVIKKLSREIEGERSKKQHVTQKHGREKSRCPYSAFGPLQDARRKPIARQQRE